MLSALCSPLSLAAGAYIAVALPAMYALNADDVFMCEDETRMPQPVLPREPDPVTTLVLPGGDALVAPLGLHPVIEVAFDNGLWRSFPEDISEEIYQTSLERPCVGYRWDENVTGPGAFALHAGDRSAQSPRTRRYELDFETMTQTNIANQRKRTFRVCWTKDAGPARWTGQLTR